MKSWLKGGLIGIILGIILNVILLFGIFACNWNPVEGSVVPKGICRTPLFIFFYPLIIFSFLITGLLVKLISESIYSFAIIFSALISTLIIAGIFSLAGLVIGKIRSKK